MRFNLLDTVVLKINIPESNMYIGDIGAIVELYDPDGIEVEFISADGTTQALITLDRNDVRPVSGSDILAVRSLDTAA